MIVLKVLNLHDLFEKQVNFQDKLFRGHCDIKRKRLHDEKCTEMKRELAVCLSGVI